MFLLSYSVFFKCYIKILFKESKFHIKYQNIFQERGIFMLSHCKHNPYINFCFANNIVVLYILNFWQFLYLLGILCVVKIVNFQWRGHSIFARALLTHLSRSKIQRTFIYSIRFRPLPFIIKLDTTFSANSFGYLIYFWSYLSTLAKIFSLASSTAK